MKKVWKDRDRATVLVSVAIVIVVAFFAGRLSTTGASSREAWAGPPSTRFPVDAGQQRKQMLEELRRIRGLLDDRL